MTTIPNAVIHGITSRLSNRCTDEQVERIKTLLAGEHEMDRAITFVVPGYSGFEFHVMIRRATVENKPAPQWQTAILVVTKTIKFVFDEPPAVTITVSDKPIVPENN